MREKQDELTTKLEVVSCLEDEVAAVSSKLQELECSTEDLKTVSLGSSDVRNQRENYEVWGILPLLTRILRHIPITARRTLPLPPWKISKSFVTLF